MHYTNQNINANFFTTNLKLVGYTDESDLTDGYLDTKVEGIALKNLPSFLRTTDRYDTMYNFTLEQVEESRNAAAIVLNTMDDLEQETLTHLATIFPPIYSIGPLHLLEKNHVHGDNLSSIESNLWREQHDCLEWLDKQEPNSVVYVNFGCVAVRTPKQLIEFSWGLANSKHKLLWLIRPAIVSGESAVLPREFLNETKERSLLASWCSQSQVLLHPSIGGFLTHSGWNSTIESLSGGVPMVCCSFSRSNKQMLGFVVAMEIDCDVKRGELERMVRELMEGEEGKLLRRNAQEWKRISHEATSSISGKAYLNLDKLVDNVLLASKN